MPKTISVLIFFGNAMPLQMEITLSAACNI